MNAHMILHEESRVHEGHVLSGNTGMP